MNHVARLSRLGHDPDRPATPIDASIHEKGIVCLFDGIVLKDITRHLRVMYGIGPAQYREFWRLGDDYPMTSPALAELGRADLVRPRLTERRVLAG